jgi:hypothetical protein
MSILIAGTPPKKQGRSGEKRIFAKRERERERERERQRERGRERERERERERAKRYGPWSSATSLMIGR